MPRFVRRLFLLFALLVAGIGGAAELWETLPETGEPVKDFAGMLSVSEKDALVATLRDFHAKTGAGLVVVTVPSLEGSDIETFSNRLFNRWGVGEKKDDRGVMFVIAKNDRKMRIECGYGAESLVPDAITKHIILDDVTPAFKAGRYPEGIVAGCRVIMARFGYDAGGAPPAVSETPESVPFPGGLIFIILIVVIIFISIAKNGGTGGGWSIGGGSGSGGGWGGGSSGGGGWSGSGGGSSGGGGASGSW